jgi:hypothetical protein
MAGYVIHTPRDLEPVAEPRASELGPSDVLGFGRPEELLRTTGFSVVTQQDVTDVFRVTCGAIVEAREQLEAELRTEMGDEVYEEDQAKKRRMLIGISEGVLVRSLVVAVKR